jgi:ParB/RepB/Spo0J family partition protein
MSNSTSNIQQIDTSLIIDDAKFNCRGNFTDSSVMELRNSIKRDGLLQPIVVSPRPDGKYDLVAGFRRFRAIKQLDWESVPANVQVLDEKQKTRINLLENMKRKDLNILQEAWGVEHFAKLGVTPQMIADELNVSTQWVNVRLALLTLPFEAQQQAIAGMLSNSDILNISKHAFEEDKLNQLAIINDARNTRSRLKLCRTTREIVDVAAQRKVGEINQMIIHLQSVFGNNITTAALCWANGSITTRDFYRVIDDRAKELDIHYDPPCSLD